MKRRIIALALATIFMTSTLMAGGTLQNGTPVSIRLQNEISSGSTETPSFVVAFDVKDPQGNLLIKEGTPVLTKYDAVPRKAIGRPGEINIAFQSTTTVDGQIVQLNGAKNYKAKDQKGKVIGIAVGCSVFLLFPMLAYLAKKGQDVTVQPNIITNGAYTLGNVNVK